MKNLRKHPILYFSLLFVVLAAIQSYFLYNTVLLKKSEIKRKAKEIFEKTTVDYSFLEDTRWDESLYLWQEFDSKAAARQHFETEMKLKNDSLAKELRAYVKQQYKESGLELAFKKELLSVYDNTNNQQIVSKPIVIYTTNPKPIENYLLSESKWESTQSNSTTETQRDTLNTKSFDDKINIARTYEKSVSKIDERSYVIQQAIYYDILNMNTILFKELWGLFAVSIFIMIMVLVLYFQSYKKYNEQRKQVLLLHDTIDNISHEFKTPLATLKIASKQIQKAYSTETLTLMDRQINRLEHLLKPLNTEDFQNNRATKKQIVEFIDDYKTLYPNINWEISIETLTDELPINVSDLETILGNLIDNSIKYGGKNIQISIFQNENALRIDVIDDGIGIAMNEQKYIFDKYYRVPINNIHSVKGLGVGLYLVSKIVEKYHGTIQVKSSLGKGCHLSIEL
ncbi:two-component system, OmpR family, phosphate regulon sensor histidine kinase PhoR [Paenimyroides ummariense]|uniref:histidine kinase n=1 Tax=Paenimyroides ummariense TaxID=913024 RepID=A0A1I4WKI9_9FLAO|nr:HAMP domain-containing sensor histidine kinase [Paenimyroides ummariense]SFN14291.1 two-component system, OmpR family, phosphate regulon sensor histidine kinase PhoR [Paenimyroides ummariense]